MRIPGYVIMKPGDKQCIVLNVSDDISITAMVIPMLYIRSGF